MQGFFERARQALGVGPDAFLPSNLDAQAITLKELDVFAPNLRDMLKATQAFADNTNKYLETTAAYITDAPFPRLWMQGSPSEPATTTQMPVPTEHAAWFDAGVAEHEAGIVPSAVGCALRAELVAPMEQWLWAYQVAQGQLSELEGKRLAYDAERRRLVQHATTATTAPPPAAAPTVEDPELAQLAEDAAAVNARLSEFESDVEALDDLLHWLVEGAVRLKALLADSVGGVGVAADSWTIPPGIMPPFPEKSTFGEDLEVTVKNVSDSPGGPEEVVASSTAAAGDTPAQAQPDLSKILPADDAMVYAGGVAPAAGTGQAEPPGGGVVQMVKDTLMKPTDAGDTDVNPAAPEVSRSAHSYSGQGTGRIEARMADAAAAGLGAAQRRMGRSRSADSPASAATVGGSEPWPMGEEAGASDKQLALVPSPDTSSDSATATATATTAAAPGASGIDPSSPAADTAGMVALHPSEPADTAETVGEIVSDSVLDNCQGSTPDDDVPSDAPSDADDSSSSPTAVPQSGGVWEAVKRTAAAAGSAAATAGSVAAATASAVLHAVPVPGIRHEGFGSQLSSEAEGDDDASSSGLGAGDTNAAGAAAGQGAGGDSAALHSHPLAAEGSFDKEAAATEAVNAIPSAATTAAAAAEGSGVDAGALVGSQLEPGPDEAKAVQQQGEEDAGQSSGAEQSSSSGGGGDPKAVWTGEVVEAFQQGKDKHAGPAPNSSTPTAPVPDKGTWEKGTTTTAGKMEGSDIARDQEQGQMHIGPVTPSSGPSEPAPGSATWAKGPTVPGGAAAGGVHVRDETGGFKDTDVAQGRMDVGPVLDTFEDPTGLERGGAIWAKVPTPPGGAAAAAPAGSNADTDMARDTQQDSSSGSKAAPDLSKMLPTYERGIPEVHSKPEGGSFGAFIKDTLLGPKRE